jgi:hypothetical protein
MTVRSENKLSLCAVAAICCLAAVAERQPIDRYQSIIERQMFGRPPPNFDPTVPPGLVQKGSSEEKELTREQEAVKSSIHFSAINVTPSGDVAVGFTDNSDSKMPIHYYLKVGEVRNGWKVLEADPVKATMKIAKGDIEVELDLGANSAKGGGSTSRAGAMAASSIAANRRAGLLGGMRRSSADGEQPRSGMMGASLRERRALREQARQEELAKEKELEAKRQAEAAEKEKEREAQRQAEKEEQRRELQLLKDELRAQREAVERARAEREAARSNENAEDEN